MVINSITSNPIRQLIHLALPVLVFTTASCSSHSEQEADGSDSTASAAFSKPGFVSAVDSARINEACQMWFDTVLKPRDFSGGMLVAKNGRVLFERYQGGSDIPGTDTNTPQTPMHIASVTKTFTAMAVLKLVQDGKLGLDDEFSKYFTAFNYPGVTVRHLLSHRSGLPNYNYFIEQLGWNKALYVTNTDVLNYLVDRKTELTDILPPGKHFAYCNTNYALLALLIEKISGKSYFSFLNDSFFLPLQMKHTYVFTIADSARATPSYNWRGKKEPFNFLDQVYGDKNIYSTPQDLFNWHQALTSYSIINASLLQEAYTPYSNEKPGIRNYGLGWRMNIFPNGNKIIYHNGWWHGSNATFIRLLNEQATIIVIGNKFTRAIYQAKVLASLFGNYYGVTDDEMTDASKNLHPLADSLPIPNPQDISK